MTVKQALTALPLVLMACSCLMASSDHGSRVLPTNNRSQLPASAVAIWECRTTTPSGLGPGLLTQSAPFKDTSASPNLPSVQWREVPVLQMPGVDNPGYRRHEVDSNSPAHWDGDTLYLFNSFLHPWRSSGPDLMHLDSSISTQLGQIDDRLWIWIESTWKDDDGTLYGIYHYEPDNVCFGNDHLPTAPKIGWLISLDNGQSWRDMGFILAADPADFRCDTKSPWDAGGEGDFSVILDRKKEYFYIFFSSYVKNFREQGVGVARLPYADRDNPAGKALKWYNGQFSEPGVGGHFTPIFPAKVDWHGGNADIFWGPAIHWNTYLNTYVILLNHAIDSKMTQEGIYITYNSDLENPKGWSEPQRVLDRDGIMEAIRGFRPDQSNGWYPEVIGTRKGETDKLCGHTGRFFMKGMSRLEIIFLKPREKSE